MSILENVAGWGADDDRRTHAAPLPATPITAAVLRKPLRPNPLASVTSNPFAHRLSEVSEARFRDCYACLRHMTAACGARTSRLDYRAARIDDSPHGDSAVLVRDRR